jgi:hypothetical protein
MSRRRVTQIVLGCFVFLLLIAPLYESFDRWDGFPKSGNDTMLNLIAGITFAGLVLVAAKSFPGLVSVLATAFSFVDTLFAVRSSRRSCVPRSSIGESPPLLLHCPLRL